MNGYNISIVPYANVLLIVTRLMVSRQSNNLRPELPLVYSSNIYLLKKLTLLFENTSFADVQLTNSQSGKVHVCFKYSPNLFEYS